MRLCFSFLVVVLSFFPCISFGKPPSAKLRRDDDIEQSVSGLRALGPGGSGCLWVVFALRHGLGRLGRCLVGGFGWLVLSAVWGGRDYKSSLMGGGNRANIVIF